MEEAPVKVFVMGINEWREENEWPLARTEYIPFYFHGNGKANTRAGDGSLSREKPLNEPADQFIYNPENPVPTNGRSEEHTSELQSRFDLVCRLLLETK